MADHFQSWSQNQDQQAAATSGEQPGSEQMLYMSVPGMAYPMPMMVMDATYGQPMMAASTLPLAAPVEASHYEAARGMGEAGLG